MYTRTSTRIAPPGHAGRFLTGPLGCGALLLAFVCGCVSYHPQWTPDNTRPPRVVPEALENAASTPEPDGPRPAAGAPEGVPEDGDASGAAPLTLDAALRTAFLRNRELEVREYAPEIIRQAIAEARAAFDPSISVTGEYSDQDRPSMDAGAGSGFGMGSAAGTSDNAVIQQLADIREFLEAAETIREIVQGPDIEVSTTEGFGTSVELAQPLPTGATLSLTGNYQRTALLGSGTDYTGTWNIALTQALLRGFGPDVNLVGLRKARNNAAIGDLAFRDYALTLAEGVENSYWDLALARETLRIRQFSLQLAQEQLALNEAHIEVGKLPGSDRISAEAEVASQKAALISAQADLHNSAIELWRLMNPESQAPADLSLIPLPLPDLDAVSWSLDTSLALASQFRPDLAQARLDVENGTLDVVETKNGLLPRLDAFVSYGTYSTGATPGAWNDHLYEDTFDQVAVGLNFNMTLGNRAEKARHRSALYARDQAAAAVRNLEQLVETDIRKALVELDRQREQITASQQEVAMREEELAVETEQFRLGRSTNFDVMQVRRDYIQARVDEVAARVHYLQALTALFAREGTLLTRRGVALEIEEEKES